MTWMSPSSLTLRRKERERCGALSFVADSPSPFVVYFLFCCLALPLTSFPLLSFCSKLQTNVFVLSFYSSFPPCRFVHLQVTWTPFSRAIIVDRKEE